MDQKDLEAIRALMQETIKPIDARLGNMEADISEMKADLTAVKADLAQVKEDVAYTREQMDVLYSWVDRIDLKVKNLVG